MPGPDYASETTYTNNRKLVIMRIMPRYRVILTEFLTALRIEWMSMCR